MADTEVLGRRVPAGANIILNTRFHHPLPKVPEDIRSKSSQAAQEKRLRGGLEGESGRDLDVFEPRRWLTKDEKGKEVFDPNSLPSLIFGGGLRGCFGKYMALLQTLFCHGIRVHINSCAQPTGKKLAMQELRIIIVLLILNFDFRPLPGELASMEGVEKLFRRPRSSHVNLAPL